MQQIKCGNLMEHNVKNNNTSKNANMRLKSMSDCSCSKFLPHACSWGVKGCFFSCYSVLNYVCDVFLRFSVFSISIHNTSHTALRIVGFSQKALTIFGQLFKFRFMWCAVSQLIFWFMFQLLNKFWLWFPVCKIP